MKVYFLDESGDTRVTLTKKKGITRHYVMLAVNIKKYDELAKTDLEELVSRVTGVSVNFEELKSDSLGRLFERELGPERVDEAFMKIVRALREYGIEAKASYVDKKPLKVLLEGLGDEFELRDKFTSFLDSLIQKLAFEELLNILDSEYKILIVDDKFFKTKKPPKRIPNAEWAIADSSSSPGLQVADLLAGCVRRALLHGGELLKLVEEVVELVAAARALEDWQPPGRRGTLR